MSAPDPTEAMRTRLQADLRGAMKARDSLEIAVLRCLIAAFDNAGAIDVTPPEGPARFAGSEHVAAGLAWGAAEATRRSLSDAQVLDLIEQEVAKHAAAVSEFDRCARREGAERARREMAIAARYRGDRPT